MEYKYKAFISYRHLEPDMQAAERLQKLLESYKPPKNLGKTKENWRIFRDVSELQSSSDLSEDIKNAIETSEFLIVICSPKYTESKWCMQELTRFRELHGNTNKNIITLLVSGLPQESFPKELTYTEMTTTNEKGEEVKVKVEVEPLAANITADTLKESMKKLNTEYLRIAAPLLGCDFNDLFQREKRREAARRRRIFGGVSGILSVITLISVISAVTIKGKNVQITEQNEQIKEQNAQIERKNHDLLVENAGHLAVESENLFQENSLIPAIRKAVEALPKKGEDKPVLPEAEYALSRELGMFAHSQLVPQLALRHDCAVEQLSFMGGGKSIVTQDATGVYFWDAETGALIKKITASDSEFASAGSGSANQLTAHLEISSDKTGTYYENTSAPSSIIYENSAVFGRIYDNFVHSVDEEEPGTGEDVYISNSDGTVWRLDGATGEIKWKAAPSEKAGKCYDIIYDTQYVLRLFQDKKEMPGGTVIPGNDIYLELLDRATGTAADTVKVTAVSGSAFSFMTNNHIQTVRGGVLYIFSDDESKIKTFTITDHAVEPAAEIEVENPNTGGIHNVTVQFEKEEPLIISCSVLAFKTTTELSRRSTDSLEETWRAELPVNYQNGGSVFLMPAADTGYTHDVLAVMTNRTLSFVDYEDGSTIKNITLDSEVIDVSYSRRGLVMFTVKDGTEYVVSLGHFTTGSDTNNAAYRVQTMNTALSLCSYSRGRYVTADNYSNTAYIQYSKQNPHYTDIDAGEYMYNRAVRAVSADGSYAAITATNYPEGKYNGGSSLTDHFFLYEVSSGKLQEIPELTDCGINSAAFIGNNVLAVNAKKRGGLSFDDVTYLIDTANMQAREIADAPKAKRTNVQLVSTSSGVFYLSDSERNLAYITADGKCSEWAETAESGVGADKEIINSMYAVSGSRAAVYARLNQDGGKKALAVYDFGQQQETALAFDFSADEGLEVQHIFWQNEDTIGVFFSNRTVLFFDAQTGKLNSTVPLDGIRQEPVSAVPTGNNTFAVLCRDSCFYEMSQEGFTGRSCRLDFANALDNEIREADSSQASKLTVQPTADGSHLFAVWDSAQAWLLDKDRFTVRYRVDSFAGAPASGDSVFISDDNRNKIGFFPIYTTQQLLDAAEQYLSALGET